MTMHRDEVATSTQLVNQLLQHQFPQWADLPVQPVASAGTDNAMFRLGDELAVRLPRIHWAVDNVAKEQKWLPLLAPRLPLAVPVPVAAGQPEAIFPYPWSVVEWLPGDMATLANLADPVAAARDLAAFVRRLQQIDPAGGPRHNRGGPVRLADAVVRRNIGELRGEIDAAAFTAAWDRVLGVPDYQGPPVWFHGDLAYLNLLAADGRLSAVIDWGTCGVGDPAIESIIAWSLFPAEARLAYREALDLDDATWERGKGWVLTGITGVTYYRDSNPTLVADKLAGINAVLNDSA